MVTTTRRKNISISLPTDLVDDLDTWAGAEHTNRSAVVADLIEQERQRRFEAELEQAYREMTEDGFFDDVEFYLPAQAEVVLAEPWEPEAR